MIINEYIKKQSIPTRTHHYDTAPQRTSTNQPHAGRGNMLHLTRSPTDNRQRPSYKDITLQPQKTHLADLSPVNDQSRDLSYSSYTIHDDNRPITTTSIYPLPNPSPTITSNSPTTSPTQIAVANNTDLLTNASPTAVSAYIAAQVARQINSFKEATALQLQELRDFTEKMDISNQCFQQNHKEQMLNTESQLQHLSATQATSIKEIESLTANTHQNQVSLNTINQLLKKQETQANNTEQMLQTILSTLLQKPTQNNVPNAQNQENPISTQKPLVDDTKRKRPAESFEDHSSSKNSRSSSISTSEANFMDTDNPDLSQHHLTQVQNTRNTKVSYTKLSTSVSPYTIANRTPLFVRHSGKFSKSPPRRKDKYVYSDRYRERTLPSSDNGRHICCPPTEHHLGCKSPYCDHANHNTLCDQYNCTNPLCTNRFGNNTIDSKQSITILPTGSKGLGGFATKLFNVGDPICHYTGDILPLSTYHERQQHIQSVDPDEHEKNYAMNYDSQHKLCARYYGNLSRFLNHSCQPNCFVVSKEAYGQKSTLYTQIL
jgi:hypothetical protein